MLVSVTGNAVVAVTDRGMITVNYVPRSGRFRGIGKAMPTAVEANTPLGQTTCGLPPAAPY